MAFVMVLSYSRHLFLRFYLNGAMNNFLRGHVEAFTAWGAVPRVVLYDFVPGNKIIVMCPEPLCGGRHRRLSFAGRTADRWPHNQLQRVQPSEKGFIVLPDCTSGNSR
jgi:hypothetical protein